MTNPTVLIIAPQPFFEERGTPISLRLVAAGLTELGYDVDFLTFPIGKTVTIPGVNTIRIGNPLSISSVPIGFSFRKLFLDLLLFAKARTLLKLKDYVRVHTSEEAVYAPLLFLRRTRERIVYDMASSLPEQLAAHQLFRLGSVQTRLARFEKYALRNVGYVFCSSGLLDYVRKIAPETAASEWIFPSHRASVKPEAVKELQNELGLNDDAFPIVYTGSFASYQGLDVVVEAISAIISKVPSAVVILVGGSNDEVDRLRATISPRYLNNVRVLPKQPRDRIPVFFSLAAILLSTRSYGKNVPLKVFDYMAAERPIVASDVPSHREILGSGRAVLYEPTPAGLASAIQYVYSHVDANAKMLEATSKYCADHLSWESFVESLKLAYRE